MVKKVIRQKVIDVEYKKGDLTKVVLVFLKRRVQHFSEDEFYFKIENNFPIFSKTEVTDNKMPLILLESTDSE